MSKIGFILKYILAKNEVNGSEVQAATPTGTANLFATKISGGRAWEKRSPERKNRQEQIIVKNHKI